MLSDYDRTTTDVDHHVLGISGHPAYLQCSQVGDTNIESYELYFQLPSTAVLGTTRNTYADGDGRGEGAGGAGDHDGGGREARQPVDGDGHPPPHWQTSKCHRQTSSSGFYSLQAIKHLKDHWKL